MVSTNELFVDSTVVTDVIVVSATDALIDDGAVVDATVSADDELEVDAMELGIEVSSAGEAVEIGEVTIATDDVFAADGVFVVIGVVVVVGDDVLRKEAVVIAAAVSEDDKLV